MPRLAIDAGASIVGGCCGNKPAHVAAMRRALDEHIAGERPSVEAIVAALGPLMSPPAQAAAAPRSRPARALSARGADVRGRRGRGRTARPLPRPRRRGPFSRTRLKALIEDGRVRVDGAVAADPARKLGPGAVVTLDPPPAVETDVAGDDIPLDVVFEDAHLIVVDKPAGLVVHPAPGHPDGTLVNALIHHCGASLRASAASSGRASSTGSTRTRRACWSSPRPTPPIRGSPDCSPITAARARWCVNIVALAWNDFGRSSGIGRRARSAATHMPRDKMAVVGEGRGRHAVTHWRIGEALRRRRLAAAAARDRAHAPDPRPPRPYRPPGARRFRLRRRLQDQGESAAASGARRACRT